jgi:carboxylesterase
MLNKIDLPLTEDVIPGCEAFYNKKGETACLLIHGLCGSPYEVAKLSDFLNAQNYTTLAPRYPGHGTRGKIMDKFGWQDWYDEVERSYLELIKNYPKVYVIGFSTGGALALKLSTKYKIEKLVVVSTFIEATKKWFYIFKPETYLKTVGKLFNYLPTLPPPNLSDPVARREYIRVSHFSLNSIRNTLELIRDVKQNIFQVTAPILIIHSRRDITTSPSSAQFVYDNVTSKEKELLWLEKSNHIVFLDVEKNYVFEKIYDYLER